MVAIAIAIIARVAVAGFVVIGLRDSRRSRGRVGADAAADAAVFALDTSSFRRVADNAHSRAVAAPIRRSRRLRFPIENAVRSALSLRRSRRFPTPHASTMQVAHARAEPAFSTTYGDIGRLRTPDSCWTECMLQDTACRLRSLRAYPIEFADTFPSTCPGAYTGFTGAYGDLRRSVRGISRSIRLPAQDFLLAVNLLALSDGVAKGCRYRPPEVIARPAALCRDRRSAQNPGPRSAARTPRCPGRAPRSGRRRPGCRRHRLREPPRAAVPDSRGRA